MTVQDNHSTSSAPAVRSAVLVAAAIFFGVGSCVIALRSSSSRTEYKGTDKQYRGCKRSYDPYNQNPDINTVNPVQSDHRFIVALLVGGFSRLPRTLCLLPVDLPLESLDDWNNQWVSTLLMENAHLPHLLQIR
jgi:hypothetical protein